MFIQHYCIAICKSSSKYSIIKLDARTWIGINYPFCWWKKSQGQAAGMSTKTPVNNGIFAISGFLPLFTGVFTSQVVQDFLNQQYMYECFFCSLWCHQECEDLSFLGGNNLCFQNIPITNPILSNNPASIIPFLFPSSCTICLLYALHVSVSSFPVVFFWDLRRANNKNQHKIREKKQTKIHPKNPKQAKVPLGQVQVAFFQYKHQLQLRCHEAFHCLQHGRTAVYRGTHGPGHRSAIPADGKQGGLVGL